MRHSSQLCETNSIWNDRRRCRCGYPMLGLLLMLLSGCDGRKAEKSTEQEQLVPVAADSGLEETRIIPASEMRKRLGANERAEFERAGTEYVSAILADSGATTLEPLKGQPLKLLDISKTKISDLIPLEGMPLEKLGLLDTPVKDLSPLKGMPLVLLDASETDVSDLAPVSTLHELQELYLEKAKVSDVTPLKDLQLTKLWLGFCPVKDLGSLAGHHFEELNLCNTPISSLDVVRTMKLGTLWLRETAVKDLMPLSAQKLVSLDIQGTPVKDLSPLTEMTSLQRLNIAQTAVTDLTPLAGLHLTRLIFSPERITKGIEVVRGMSSLQQIDTSFEGTAPALNASEFWERYDRGSFKAESAP